MTTDNDTTVAVAKLFDACTKDYMEDAHAISKIMDAVTEEAAKRAVSSGVIGRPDKDVAALSKHLVKGSVVEWAIDRFGRDDILQIVEDWEPEDGDEEEDAA